MIGDVHGCTTELEELLALLGYEIVEQRAGGFPDGGPLYAHPGGRRVVYVGDLANRGPRVLDTITDRPEHRRAPAPPSRYRATTT